MWRPGFDYRESTRAQLFGFHRSLCVASWVHRGTEETPGLVLGLKPGGSCQGIAYRVASARWPAVLRYLRQREQATQVYRELFRRIVLHRSSDDGSRAEPLWANAALVFVVDRTHRQYVCGLSQQEQARRVRVGVGRSGRCIDYLGNTVSRLAELGLEDAQLWRIYRIAKEMPGDLHSPDS